MTKTAKPPTREDLQTQLDAARELVSRLQSQGLPDNSQSLIDAYTNLGRITRQMDALTPKLTPDAARAELAQLSKEIASINKRQYEREKEVGIVRAAAEFDTQRLQISQRTSYLNNYLKCGDTPAPPQQRALTTAERAEVNRLQGQITALQDRLEGVTEQAQQIRLVSQINIAKGRLSQFGVAV